MTPSASCPPDKTAREEAGEASGILLSEAPLAPSAVEAPARREELSEVCSHLRPCSPSSSTPVWPIANRNSA